ncbi:MAG TPA: pyridoxine 5'-phosphate oxidase C-terminal domain-containing protein [Pseudoneobacillus sp.]|nr:pyridoxine 5'-phosphate oxidase C-terminal domain-containing protein [Pseudoneobacillus sp.]
MIGKQSSILRDQHEFDDALTKQINNLQHNPNIVYPSWTLYRVEANEVKFWQADKERKHVRLKFNLEGAQWLKNLLWA